MVTSQVMLVVIDGDPESRKSAAALALSMRIRCETFACAQTFLDRYDPSLTGCALVDLQLGGMDILQLQDRLKALGSALSVVLISAHADMSLVVRALRRGALAFLEKPYKHNELADAICRAIEHSARVRTSPAEEAGQQGQWSSTGGMGKACSVTERGLNIDSQ
jgi:two-component system, LuxR family, response regulator FixJ